MEKINVVVLDTTKNIIHALAIDKNLDSYYDTIHCDIIDIVERKIGNNYYDIICDDEGLFKEEKIPSVLTTDDYGYIVEQIVGSVIICSHNDEDGETVGLTDEQIVEVLQNTKNIMNNKIVIHATL